MEKLFKSMEVIKEFCNVQDQCDTCPMLVISDWKCLFRCHAPHKWNTDSSGIELAKEKEKLLLEKKKFDEYYRIKMDELSK